MSAPEKTRIAIAGIGGIGGYIGGKLAYYYSNAGNTEIVFIAKGEMLKAINKDGLQLQSNGTLYKCLPGLTSDDPREIGIIDILILCTKNFSLPDVLKKYASCLTQNTTVITTQNTVNGKATITPMLPQGATLMEGCIYIASNIAEPGKVAHVSGPAKFIFGTEGESNKRGEVIAAIFKDAGIDAAYTTNIQPALWKKFMFVSPAAIVTALFQIAFSEIAENKKAKYLFSTLTAELMQLATAKNIAIDANTQLNNIDLLTNFKGRVKSSFQLDLENGKPAEINSLVKYVIDECRLFHVPAPGFDKALIQLTETYTTLLA